MNERRRTKRTDLSAKLILKRLDDGKNQTIAVDIHDVSKSGMGFFCPEPLTIGAMYEADLKIWKLQKNSVKCTILYFPKGIFISKIHKAKKTFSLLPKLFRK